jgi:hypothetical protein
MKRRQFLRNTALGATAAAIPATAFSLPEVEYDYISPHDDNEFHSVSENLDDFKITIDRTAKLIDVKPLTETKPMLDMTTYHRHISDLSDQMDANGNDVIDITDSTPSYRSSPSVIELAHGWKITPRGEHSLYGTIIREDGTCHYTLHIMGSIDYRMIRNMRLFDDLGYEYGIYNTGYIGVDLYKDAKNLTLTYEKYVNGTGEWTDELWITQIAWGCGPYPIPVLAMG